MDVKELRDRQKPELVKEQEYENECKAVPFGYLNAQDVVRIWGGPEDVWSKNAGKRATELVADLELPLTEMGGTGKWMAKHTVETS